MSCRYWPRPPPPKKPIPPKPPQTLNLTRESEADGIPASDVAALVLEALTSPRPRARYMVGKGAPVVQVMRRLLPDWMFDPLIVNYYKPR